MRDEKRKDEICRRRERIVREQHYQSFRHDDRGHDRSPRRERHAAAIAPMTSAPHEIETAASALLRPAGPGAVRSIEDHGANLAQLAVRDFEDLWSKTSSVVAFAANSRRRGRCRARYRHRVAGDPSPSCPGMLRARAANQGSTCAFEDRIRLTLVVCSPFSNASFRGRTAPGRRRSPFVCTAVK